MKPKHYAPAALLLLTAATGSAQNYTDAARFGMLIPQGTARSVGFGSALGSVGGDFSSLSVNPAGISIYRRGELSFSPSFHFGENDFTYSGQKSTDNFAAFNISNVGLVAVAGPGGNEGRGWRSWGFGIGLNRVADFNRNYTYTGLSTESAFSETFSRDANLQNVTPDVLGSDENASQSLGNLGYQHYLINYDTAAGQFYPVTGYGSVTSPLRQTKSVQERGGINELAVSVGGNYEEKVMVGATVGVPFLRYKRTMNFTETDVNGTIPEFQQMSYQNQLTTTGVGVNLKLGVIIKPSNAFRFGAAIHTPTWYALNDEEDNSLSTNTEGIYPNNNFSLLTRQFEYSMRTPWRAVVSATGFLANWGFVSADYEYVDYASSRITLNTTQNQILYGSNNFALQQQMANDSLKANLQGASNFRIGFESRLDVLYLRAGLGFYGSPYKKSELFGDGTRTYQVGVGYRGKSAFADLAFMNSQTKTGEYAYQLPYNTGTIAPQATGNTNRSNIVLTFGVKF